MNIAVLNFKNYLRSFSRLARASLLVVFSIFLFLLITDVAHAQNRAAMQKRLQAAKQKQKQWTPPPIRLPEAVIEKPKKPVISVKKIDREPAARKSVADAADAIDTILQSEWSAAGITKDPSQINRLSFPNRQSIYQISNRIGEDLDLCNLEAFLYFFL